MHRIDGLDTFTTLPAPRPLRAPGYFGPGNPATGQLTTQVTYEWANAVQEELVGVVAAAGIAPDKTDNVQVLAAIRGLAVGAWDKTLYCAPPEATPKGVSLVFGSNAKLYQSTAPSGPGTPAGPQDPVTSSGYWEIASLTPAMINDSSLGFPSDTYVDIPWGANNMTYVAPADGWVAASRGSTASLQYIYIRIPSVEIYVQSVAVGIGPNVPVAGRVAKGQTVQISWTLGGSPNFLRFIPARKVS